METYPLYDVKLNPDVLQNLKKITNISPSMVFKKENDGVVLRVKNSIVAACYMMGNDDFDFYGDEIAFVDFKNFLDYLDQFKEDKREIKQDRTGNLRISYGNCSLKYRTSDTRILRKHAFNNVKDDSPLTVEILINKKDLGTISAACKKIKPTEVKVSFSEDGRTTVHIINSKTYHEFEVGLGAKARTHEIDSVTLNPEIFTDIPEDDYEFSISKIGRCSMVSADMFFFCGLKKKPLAKATDETVEMEEEIEA